MTVRTAEIGDLVETVSGPAFKSARFTDDPSDVPLIKGENIAQGYIAWEKSRYWPTGESEEYERFGLVAGDIVLAMDRPWVTAGLKWARLKPHDPPSLLVQRVARLRAKPGLRQDFLTYVIGSAAFSDYVRNIMGGTNVPHISGAQIKAFKFRLPGENEQRAIADTLSAYDDLIENNRRRIALLEEAARLLCREWFVHFRFPGHEHAKIINGLPEGWVKRELGELAKINKGRNITKNSIDDGDVPVVAGGLKPAYYHNVSNTKSPVVTVSASGANAGYVAIYLKDIWASDCSYMTIDENPHIWFWYLTLKCRQVEITSMQQGAAQPHVYPKHLRRMQIVMPPLRLLEEFQEIVGRFFALVRNLQVQSDRLAAARDILLPRLMNGEIAV